ncbi:MAG: histidine kinase [Cyclobacteriaceae bacterium]
MRHPILSGSGYKLYALILGVIMLIHGSVLYFYYGFPVTTAIGDSVLYNALFGVLAPGLWYIVSFASLSKDELALAGTHLAAAVLTVFLWTSISDFALGLIFSAEIEYGEFLDDSYIWRLIIGVLYYSITVLIFYLIKYYQDMQERLNKELELQNLLKDSELRMLKSQINPHFIFNSLNSISALTISKSESAREMVIKLSNFLRYSLGKDSIEMNTLEEEIKNSTLYLDIEKVRFGSKLSFDKEVSDTCLKVEVPNLILQPLFENAVKYGVYESIDKVSIMLKCEPHEDMLHILISNNFDVDAMPPKGEGIGLENVRKRLSLVYGRHDLLEVSQKEGIFNVTLKIPTNHITHA